MKKKKSSNLSTNRKLENNYGVVTQLEWLKDDIFSETLVENC